MIGNRHIQTQPIAQMAIAAVWVAGCLVFTATTGQAQQISTTPMISVPPPPPLVPIPAMPSSPMAPTQETVFQAPPSFQGTTSGRYLVYVNGDSPYLLQQVQTVEPKAFVQNFQGRPVIQVGTFGDEANARRQVELLQGQGIVASVAPLSSVPVASGLSRSNPYLVIVPGSREALPNMAQQATRLGIRQDAMQIKTSPLGPHLEIGPFTDYREASEVSRFLRGGGLDSHVFFNRW